MPAQLGPVVTKMPNYPFNALILAAGLGTRLRPHTCYLPKPLFAVAGRPILDIIICRLIDAGAGRIAVNLHHLPEQITEFIKSQNYPVPVIGRYEPQLLGTGGAIGNFADVLGRGPFVVINGDILTDISIPALVQQHRSHKPAATLVMHDCPAFNKVAVSPDKDIINFDPGPGEKERLMAFTGLQVIDPAIYDYIEPGKPVSSIDVFSAMIADGHKIKAMEVRGHYWNDLGTPESFRKGVIDTLAPEIFEQHLGQKTTFDKIQCQPLAGDGSDRKWLRLISGDKSIIVADHGVQAQNEVTEFDSFVSIGNHLFAKGASVPEIYDHDKFSGLAFAADLGDTLLQAALSKTADADIIFTYYTQIIKSLIFMHNLGKEGFDPAWAYQGPVYDRQMILEKEGLYFINAFLVNYLEMKNIDKDGLVFEFSAMADVTAACGHYGFMHRDLQSRNIMVTDKGFFFIDFQAGRIGPIQYDLASLITDPYAELARGLQHRLLDRAMDMLGIHTKPGRKNFKKSYNYCAVSRNLQALGAFAHLSRVKQKPGFVQYMPAALANLEILLLAADDPPLPVLAKTVMQARKALLTGNR